MSDPIDTSNYNFFSDRLLQTLTQMGEPGETFTIESTYIAPNQDNNDEPSNRESTDENNNGESTDENNNGESTDENNNDNPIVQNELPIQDLYSEMTRIFSLPVNSSGNIINRSTLSTSTPTTRPEFRRRMIPHNSIFENNTVFNDDVNTDYANFVENLFANRHGSGGQNMASILQSSLLDSNQNAYKNVISEKGEDAIKYCIFKTANFPQQKSCAITLTDFKDDGEISQLPCGHIFQPKAILKWLKNEDARCPACRKGLDSKEIKREKNITQNRISRNTRIAPTNLIRQILFNRIKREEEAELQQAILASIRDIEDS